MYFRGWPGGAMVLGKYPVPGRPTILITVGQGPTALVVGAGGGCLDSFTLIYPFLSSFSLSLGDGPIKAEILSQRAVKPIQPTKLTCISVFSGLSPKEREEEERNDRRKKYQINPHPLPVQYAHALLGVVGWVVRRFCV